MAEASTLSKSAQATPFIAQYLEIKSAYEDALLFFRMGDFYELFFDDAVAAAKALDITLTKRGQHKGKPIPMAGVPYHASDSYLARLIRAGFRVAICEQIETPAEAKKRGSKAVVKREVIRVVTPGTLSEDSLLEASAANCLVAIAEIKNSGRVGLAVCDVSTGMFETTASDTGTLGDTLSSIPAREVLLHPETHSKHVIEPVANAIGAEIVPRMDVPMRPAEGSRRLKDAYDVSTVEGFANFEDCELAACALLFDYLDLTQAGAPIRLNPPRKRQIGTQMMIDPATRLSLEINKTQKGERKGSLLETLDRSCTSSGARLFSDRLNAPSLDRGWLEKIYESTDFLTKDRALLEDLRSILKQIPDLDRAVGRLRLDRGGPRDLLNIAIALHRSAEISTRIHGLSGITAELLNSLAEVLQLDKFPNIYHLANEIGHAINEDPPLLARDGGFIKDGFHEELDTIRQLRDDSRRVIANLQAGYVKKTDISGLKIRFNNMLGYFIDVSAKQADPMMASPLNETFIHRQTLANNVRFTTTELAELGGRISRSEDEAKTLELSLFADLSEKVEAASMDLALFGRAIAELDVICAGATLAREMDAVRPRLSENVELKLVDARHPVVEASLNKTGEGFVSNTLGLDGSGSIAPRLIVITGPNMAGKSTYLRQAAIVTLMAQAGLFVPAKEATIGLVDRIFSRVGASDDLARGQSTFMVEMIETASILNQAGPRALVILDEVGRGTSTYDGLAIAWAVVEHLHDQNKCRALFATHYHELTGLAHDLPHAGNASLMAKEWKGDLIFLHKVNEGAADKSYGVQVAKLAGLPRAAIRRADAVLKQLEKDKSSGASLSELPLFAASTHPATDTSVQSSEVEDRLTGVNPDTLSPREALDLLYELRDLMDKKDIVN